jgi:hypothetical protein
MWLPGLVTMNVATLLLRSINCTEMHQNVNSVSYSTALGSDIISYIYFHSMNPYRITKIRMDMEKVKFV